jgi:hypothetical protein
VSAGCGQAGQDQENGLSSETQDFIARAVDKVVEGLAARLDALSEQLAAIHQAQARGTAKPNTGHPAAEAGAQRARTACPPGFPPSSCNPRN